MEGVIKDDYSYDKFIEQIKAVKEKLKQSGWSILLKIEVSGDLAHKFSLVEGQILEGLYVHIIKREELECQPSSISQQER